MISEARKKYMQQYRNNDAVRAARRLLWGQKKEFLVKRRANFDCDICKKPSPFHKRNAIDHDHKSNLIRGMLCDRCNKGIGLFDDDPSRLRAAADYLAVKNSKLVVG